MAAAIVLAVVVGFGLLAWEWRHPDAFHDADGSISMSVHSWPVGKVIFVGVTYGDESAGEVTLVRAKPDVTVNSAEANIEYYVCTPRQPGNGNIGSAGPGVTLHQCGTLELVDGPIAFRPRGGDQVLMGVTPTTPGVVQVPSSTLTYRSGWRNGSQQVGDGVRIRAAREQ